MSEKLFGKLGQTLLLLGTLAMSGEVLAQGGSPGIVIGARGRAPVRPFLNPQPLPPGFRRPPGSPLSKSQPLPPGVK